jgi:hypothetical protein
MAKVGREESHEISEQWTGWEKEGSRIQHHILMYLS